MSTTQSPPRPPYWFRAKRYGWGWGLPATWQGWVVSAAWLAAVVADGVWVAPRSLPLFYVVLAALCAILIAVCYAKGEPPRWRWGDRD
jgi:hypothetical protein